MKKFIKALLIVTTFALSSCGNTHKITARVSSDSNATGVYIPPIDSATCNASYTYKDNGVAPSLSKNTRYYRYSDVALYLVTYRQLPTNYITKDEYEDNTSKYSSSSYNIGGDVFTNYQKVLPPESIYIECDVDVQGPWSNVRGTHRIVYSRYNFRVFYTTNHYESFREYLGYNNWGPYFASASAYRSPCSVG